MSIYDFSTGPADDAYFASLNKVNEEKKILSLQSDLAAAQARIAELRHALTNLYALVRGECPALLENDHHDEMVLKALTGEQR